MIQFCMLARYSYTKPLSIFLSILYTLEIFYLFVEILSFAVARILFALLYIVLCISPTLNQNIQGFLLHCIREVIHQF